MQWFELNVAERPLLTIRRARWMTTLALLQTPGSKAGYDLPPTLRQRSIVIEHICVEGWTGIVTLTLDG